MPHSILTPIKNHFIHINWIITTLKSFHTTYLQDSSLTQPYALLSLIHGDNTQICPSYVIAAELDILRDEALVYAKQLRDNGINV